MFFCFIYMSISYYLSAQMMTWTRFLMFLFVCQLMTLISEGIGLILGTVMNSVVSQYKSQCKIVVLNCIYLTLNCVSERSLRRFHYHLYVYSFCWFFSAVQPYAYYLVLCIVHQLHEIRSGRAGRIYLRLWP